MGTGLRGAVRSGSSRLLVASTLCLFFALSLVTWAFASDPEGAESVSADRSAVEAPGWLRDAMGASPSLSVQIEAGRDSEGERRPTPVEIEASRTAFRDRTAVEAVEVAVREFPQLINVTIDPAPDLKEGERITGYPTANTAQLELPDGKHAVVESMLPLVSTTSDGSQAPVDLSLREGSDVLEPKHPIVPIRVARQLNEGFEIPSIGLTLTPTGGSGAPLQGTATVEGTVAHFANTQPDSDTIVKPIPLGLQTHSILRSPHSPERLYFRVEVEGDEDPTLTHLDDGSIAVEANSEVVTIIPPAIARDAASVDVPVSMEIDGDLLILILDHRSGGFQYPIDADPTAVDFDGFGSWEGQGNWVYETNAPGVLSGTWNTTGSKLEVDNNGQSFQYGHYGAWFYVTQGISRIYEFDATVGSPSGGNFLGIIGPAGVEAGTWIPVWPPIESSPVLCAASGCSSNGGSAGNAALFELIAVEPGSFPIFARLNSASVKIAQNQGASITFNTTDPQINGKPNALYQGGQWVQTSDEARVAFSATDPGLGISYASITSPDYGGWSGQFFSSVGGCVGIQCDSTYSQSAPVGNLGEGEKRITASVSNAAIGAEATKYVKIDNSGPTATLSGLEPGAVASLGQNDLTIKVTDGTEQNPGSGVLAGKASVALDGEEILAPGGGGCSPGPCTITRNYSFIGQEIGIGEHILTVTAVDQLGNESTTELPLVVLSSGPTVDMGPGQLNIENGDFLLSATDVAESTPGAQLSVMRTHESVRSSQQTGPLGPGWDLTLGAWRRATKMPDGSVVLTDSKGRLIIFQKDGSGYDAPPEYSGWALSYDSGSNRFTLTGPNRGSTVFRHLSKAPASLYSPFLTKNPDGEVALFQLDSYSSGILKPEHLGSETCLMPELGAPCKSLSFLYDSSTTATGDAPDDWGDYAGRLSGIKLSAWSTEGGEFDFDETTIVEYSYDAEERLRAAWDPRISPALKTTYGYDAAGHVIAVTPPGQQPWLLDYGKALQTNYKLSLLSAFRPPADAELDGDPPEIIEAPHFGEDYPHPSVAYHVWNGEWDGDPASYNYVWENCDEEGKNCAPILGAADQSYTPDIADLGSTLRAAVTASNGSGTVTARTEPSAPVEPPLAPEFDLEFGSFGTGPEQFKLLGGIALDAKGSVWVTDTGNNRFAKYSPEGKFLAAYGSKGTGNGQLESPHGIVVNPVSGNILIADTGNDRIQEFTPLGAFVKAWGSFGKGNGQLDEPSYLSTREFPGGQVLIYVSDTGNDRVQAFWTNGSYAGQAGSSGSESGQLKSPQGISVLSDHWFVADSGNNRIQEFADTKFVKAFGSSGTGPGQLNTPFAIAGEPNVGGLLVAETGGGQRVQKFALNGDYVDTFDTSGLAGGKLYWPHGVAVEEFGPTYVIDGFPTISKARVSKWMPVETPEESPPSPSPPPPGSAIWSIAYDVPLEGAETLDSSAAETVWGQQDLPTAATAVFPPDEVPSGSMPSSYKRATVYYMDDVGRIVNTQAPGDRVSTEEYDQFGNVTRTLTPENRARVLSAESGQKALSEQLDTRLTYSGGGSKLSSVLGPKHEVALENGEEVQARLSTKYFYDEGAPKSGGPYGLVTKQTEGAVVGEAEHDVRTKTFGYDGQEGLGWQLRKPTSETVDPGGLSLTSKTLYDADTGNVIETRMPANPEGGDAHATQAIYYTDGESDVEVCGERPELAGLICQTRPAAQPETPGLPELPVTTIAYNAHNQPTVTTEVVGEAVRTATIEYDDAGRPLSASISATSGKALPTVHTTYDEATGMPTVQSTETEAIVSEYDSLGLLTGYTDADGNTSTYAYDTLGRVTEVSDGKGPQIFSYDETTGDLAQVEDSAAGEFSAEYDAGGKMTSMTYPGGLEARYTYDSGGAATALEYVDTTECSEGCTWFEDEAVPSIHGETLSQASTRRSFDYGYDDAGRLVEVEETPQGEGCTTRLYAYDADTNRTAATTREPAAGGACAKSGGETQTTAFDEADRLVGEGVAYDDFGNVTDLPGAYAGGKALSSTYYVDDSAASLTQDGTSIEYMLDPLGRERESVSSDGESETQLISHFAGGGDSPAWTEDGSGNWTRYIGGMGGLSAIQSSGEGIELQIADLQGDIVATAPVEEAEGLDFIGEATEYGVPQGGAPAKYSWLGSSQRPVELESGVVAMGARTYIPQLGRFLQQDPVSGGSANAYAYVFGDPVGEADLSGEYTPGQAPPWLREVMENPPGMPPPPPPPPVETEFEEEEIWTSHTNNGIATISAGLVACEFHYGRPHPSGHKSGRINALGVLRCRGNATFFGHISVYLYRNGQMLAETRQAFDFTGGGKATAKANVRCQPGRYKAIFEVVETNPGYLPVSTTRFYISWSDGYLEC